MYVPPKIVIFARTDVVYNIFCVWSSRCVTVSFSTFRLLSSRPAAIICVSTCALFSITCSYYTAQTHVRQEGKGGIHLWEEGMIWFSLNAPSAGETSPPGPCDVRTADIQKSLVQQRILALLYQSALHAAGKSPIPHHIVRTVVTQK